MHHPCLFGEYRITNNLDTGSELKTLTRSGPRRRWYCIISSPSPPTSSRWTKKVCNLIKQKLLFSYSLPIRIVFIKSFILIRLEIITPTYPFVWTRTIYISEVILHVICKENCILRNENKTRTNEMEANETKQNHMKFIRLKVGTIVGTFSCCLNHDSLW